MNEETSICNSSRPLVPPLPLYGRYCDGGGTEVLLYVLVSRLLSVIKYELNVIVIGESPTLNEKSKSDSKAFYFGVVSHAFPTGINAVTRCIFCSSKCENFTFFFSIAACQEM